jgi:hypothetical protein
MSGTKASGGNSRTHQGYYKVKHPEKYIGDINTIIYRSSWEFSFCSWCDMSPSILRWSSEPISVPYMSRVDKLDECQKNGLNPNNPVNWTRKNYHTDFYLTIDKGDNVVEKWFIEIKPSNELKKPFPPKDNATLKEVRSFNIKAKSYLVNESKWASMNLYAQKTGCKFYVFTEIELQRLGILGGQFDLK